MQIKFKSNVWKTSYQELDDVVKGESEPCLTNADMSDCSYTLIGSAEVTVTLFSRDKIVHGEIEALNTQLQTERAESQRRQNAILDKISKLQALEFTPA